MKHIFGLRNRGDASLILRGNNGRAIRQHLTGAGAHHNHMLKRGGALTLHSVVSTIHSAPKAIANIVKKGTGRTYIPLKFRL